MLRPMSRRGRAQRILRGDRHAAGLDGGAHGGGAGVGAGQHAVVGGGGEPHRGLAVAAGEVLGEQRLADGDRQLGLAQARCRREEATPKA